MRPLHYHHLALLALLISPLLTLCSAQSITQISDGQLQAAGGAKAAKGNLATPVPAPTTAPASVEGNADVNEDTDNDALVHEPNKSETAWVVTGTATGGGGGGGGTGSVVHGTAGASALFGLRNATTPTYTAPTLTTSGEGVAETDAMETATGERSGGKKSGKADASSSAEGKGGGAGGASGASGVGRGEVTWWNVLVPFFCVVGTVGGWRGG